jgi:hypothetical protein
MTWTENLMLCICDCQPYTMDPFLKSHATPVHLVKKLCLYNVFGDKSNGGENGFTFQRILMWYVPPPLSPIFSTNLVWKCKQHIVTWVAITRIWQDPNKVRISASTHIYMAHGHIYCMSRTSSLVSATDTYWDTCSFKMYNVHVSLKDQVTPNISACRKIDNVLLIKVLLISWKNSN